MMARSGTSKRNNAGTSGRSAFELMDEGIYLIRQTNIRDITLYYIGSLPFMLGLLYFWTDMSQGAFAWRHASLASFGMAVLFIWMKVFHSIFCRNLYTMCLGKPRLEFNLVDTFKIGVSQTIFQPWGLILLPLSLILMAPFAWVYAFFQNVTVLATEDEDEGTSLFQKAAHHSRAWTLQNHIVIWLLSPWLLAFTLITCFGFSALLLSLFNASGEFWVGVDHVPWFVLGTIFAVLFVWPLCPLALVIATNIAAGGIILPIMLNTLLGIETIFVSAGVLGYMNTTLLLSVYVLTYLLMDPLVKAVYTLRCFYGNSLKTGEDIIANIQPYIKKNVFYLILLPMLSLPPTGYAENISQPPYSDLQNHQHDGVLERIAKKNEHLDRAIQHVVERREYSWRLPREKQQWEVGKLSWLQSMHHSLKKMLKSAMEWIGDKLLSFFDWLDNFFSGKDLKKAGNASEFNWSTMLKILGVGMILVASCLIATIVWRIWKQRAKTAKAPVQPVETIPIPDLSNENVTADQLPEEEWLKLAGEMMEQGHFRLALRAYYFGSLAYLERQRLLTISSFKSNRDYHNEIKLRRHVQPTLMGLFDENINLFEQSWYGDHPVTDRVIDNFQNNLHQIRRNVEMDHREVKGAVSS